MKTPDIKGKIMKGIGKKVFGNVTSLNDFFDKVGDILCSNADILDKQGLEGKTCTLRFEGQIWKAILLREKDKLELSAVTLDNEKRQDEHMRYMRGEKDKP